MPGSLLFSTARNFYLMLDLQVKSENNRLGNGAHLLRGEGGNSLSQSGFGNGEDIIQVYNTLLRHPIFRTKWHFDWDGANGTGDHANSN